MASAREEAGPSPWLTFIKAAMTWKRHGVGSKAQAVYDASIVMGSCILTLNGAPTAFYGGMVRDDDAPSYPDDTRDRAAIPDAMAVLAAKLDAPDYTAVMNAALAVIDSDGGDLLARVADLRDAVEEVQDGARFPRQVAVWQDGGSWFWDTLDSGVLGEAEPFGEFHSQDHAKSNARDYYAPRPVKFSEGLPEEYPDDWRDLLDGEA